MHLDCQVIDTTGRREYHKVFFPDKKLISVSSNEYRLERYLLSGNNGSVFTCRDIEDRVLAVKILHVLGDQRIKRFNFECQVLSGLDHPNVLPCYDVGDVETTYKEMIPYMITKLYGTNVERVVKIEGVIGVYDLIQFSIQLCDALDYIHSQGVIHRDIKPGNVLINDGQVGLGDFGLATTATEVGFDRFYREDITLSGEFIGPILWMSPELLKYANNKEHPVDQRSDLFQLAKVIWYMATGEIAQAMIDVEDDPTQGPLHVIVSRCLHSRPEKRYQSAKEMKEALEKIQ